MKKSLLATSIFLFVSCAFGQSLISHFTQPADGSIAVESDAIGQSEQRQAQNGLIYVCTSVPKRNSNHDTERYNSYGKFQWQ